MADYPINTGSGNWAAAADNVMVFVVDPTLATQDSAVEIPAGYTVTEIITQIETAFPLATMSIGQAGSLTLLQATGVAIGDNDPTVAGIYQKVMAVPWGATYLALRVTLTGALAVGAATIKVKFALVPLT